VVVRLLARYLGPRQLARAEQQGVDLRPVPPGVQFQERVSRAVGHRPRRRQRVTQLGVDGAGWPQRQRRGQVPQQLMKLPHDREHLVHLGCGPRLLAPVPPAEGDLGDLLARAEAVIHGTAAETPPPEAGVDAAAEVGLQMGTGLPGRLVDREIGRSRESRRDTAQPEAAPAVGPERALPATGGKPRRFGFCAHR